MCNDRVCCNSGYLGNTQTQQTNNTKTTHKHNRQTEHTNTTDKHNTQTHTDTHTHRWLWANAAVASCRPNLNTAMFVFCVCTRLNQTHQASSMLVSCISLPFQITAYPPIQYNSTSTESCSYPNTPSQQQCLEACWTQTLSLKLGKNYKTVLTDNLNRYCRIFHTLYKLDTKLNSSLMNWKYFKPWCMFIFIVFAH